MTKNLENVKKILEITDFKLDRYLEFCETNITNKLLDKCNITEIPEHLNSLIQEFIMEQYHINKDGIGESKLEATSASDQGQTVHFKSVGGVSNMSQNVDDFLNRNVSTWIQYRKLRW